MSNSKKEQLLASMRKKHGAGAIRALDDKSVDSTVEYVPSGSLALDIALGTGGFPKGRIIEIFGPESSGKTTIALHAIAEHNKLGEMGAFVDVEHAYDPIYGEALGIVDELTLFSQPDSAEQALEIVDDLVSSGDVSIVVVDSVAALVPQSEVQAEMGDSKMGLAARLMSQAMRKLTSKISKSGCTVIFINQIRMKIGVMFGNPETTTGGNALKFYSSMRLDVRKKGSSNKDADGTVTSNNVKIKVVKNKLAPPFKVAETEIVFGIGIDRYAEIRDYAVQYELLQKAGAWYSYNGSKIAQGAAKCREFLADNPELADELESQIKSFFA